eukprot:gene16522-22749_t
MRRSLTPGGRYILDFQELLDEPSLLQSSSDEAEGEGEGEGALVATAGIGSLRVSGTGQRGLAVASAHNASEYLQLKRTYQGLETPLTGAAEKEASVVLGNELKKKTKKNDCYMLKIMKRTVVKPE